MDFQDVIFYLWEEGSGAQLPESWNDRTRGELGMDGAIAKTLRLLGKWNSLLVDVTRPSTLALVAPRAAQRNEFIHILTKDGYEMRAFVFREEELEGLRPQLGDGVLQLKESVKSGDGILLCVRFFPIENSEAQKI